MDIFNGKTALVASVAKYGVGSLIALYLSWQMGNELPKMNEKMQSVDMKVSAIEQQHEDMAKISAENQRYFRSICLNTSETKEEIQRCN